MTLYYPELAARVRSQSVLQPELYGEIDFDRSPYRHTTDPDDTAALPSWVADRSRILDNERIVELVATATMLGDVVADLDVVSVHGYVERDGRWSTHEDRR